MPLRHQSTRQRQLRKFYLCVAILGGVGPLAALVLYFFAPIPFQNYVYHDLIIQRLAYPLLQMFIANPPRVETSTLPAYEITIDGESWRTLNDDPYFAGREWMDAYFSLEDRRNLVIKLKTKGDSIAHKLGVKKSLWIKTKAGIFINDWKRTALVTLRDPLFLVDKFAYDTAKKIDLLSPNNRYVNLFVNKKYYGIYHEVEELDKFYLQNEERTRGDLYLLDEAFEKDNDFYSLQYWKKNVSTENVPKENMQNLSRLFNCLKEFCDGLESFISTEQYLKNIILFELIGSDHLDIWHNQRIYFDPARGKFEPIHWDALYFVPDLEFNQSNDYIVQNILLRPSLRIQKLKMQKEFLSEVITERYIDEFISGYVEKLGPVLANDKYLGGYKAFNYWSFLKATRELKDSLKVRRKAMLAHSSFDPAQVRASKDTDAIYIEAPTLAHFKVFFPDNRVYSVSAKWTPRKGSYAHYGRQSDNSPNVDKPEIAAKINFAGAANLEKIVLEDQVSGEQHELSLSPISQDNSFIANAIVTPTTEREKETVVSFKAGRHYITEDMFYGKNTLFTAAPGAVFVMSPGISIITEGRVELRGTERNPIKFIPAQKQKPWGTFSVLDSPKKSIFEHTFFSGGKDTRLKNVFFSGMLNCYHADCEIYNSVFMDNKGDDAYNIKNGTTIVKNSVFIRTGFDAIDVDFSDGLVEDNIFIYSGNDSVDCGTGHPIIRNNVIWRSGDKGVSSGERSYPIIVQNYFLENDSGVAIKDSSHPLIMGNFFGNNKITINSYQKKTAFGGGRGILLNNFIQPKDASTMFVSDAQSKFIAINNLIESSVPESIQLEPTKGLSVEDLKLESADQVNSLEAWLAGSFQISRPKNWAKFEELKRKYESTY